MILCHKHWELTQTKIFWVIIRESLLISTFLTDFICLMVAGLVFTMWAVWLWTFHWNETYHNFNSLYFTLKSFSCGLLKVELQCFSLNSSFTSFLRCLTSTRFEEEQNIKKIYGAPGETNYKFSARVVTPNSHNKMYLMTKLVNFDWYVLFNCEEVRPVITFSVQTDTKTTKTTSFRPIRNQFNCNLLR